MFYAGESNIFVGGENDLAKNVKKIYIGDHNGRAEHVESVFVGNFQNKAAHTYSIYRAVDYIESTGTQFIDTGIVPTLQTAVDIEFYLTQYTAPAANTAIPFGSRNAATTSTPGFWFGDASGSKATVTVYSGTGGQEIGNVFVNEKLHIARFSLPDRNFRLDGTDYPLSGTISGTVNSSSALFGLKTGSSIGPTGGMRLYKCVLWDGTDKVADMRPCYRNLDGEIGLYDTVREIFLQNSGTGVFLKGEDI